MNLKKKFEKVCILDGIELNRLVFHASGIRQYAIDLKFGSETKLIYQLEMERFSGEAKPVKTDWRTYRCKGIDEAVICHLCPYFSDNRERGVNQHLIRDEYEAQHSDSTSL